MTTMEWLREALGKAQHPEPGNPLEALRALPAVEELPLLPWATWYLFTAHRYHKRLRWAAEIIAPLPHTPIDPRPRLGDGWTPVPGMPEWEYASVRDARYRLQHRVTGELLDVIYGPDHADAGTDYLGGSMVPSLSGYLSTLREPEPPEQRCLALHPSLDSLVVDRDLVVEAGLVVAVGEAPFVKFVFMPSALALSSLMDDFCSAWSGGGDRLWLAAAIGDWPAAHDAACQRGDAELIELTRARAEECRRHREVQLAAALRRSDEDATRALWALRDLESPALPGHLQRIIRGRFSPASHAALDIATDLNDPALCPDVLALLRRTRPSAAYRREPKYDRDELRIKCIEFLAKHHHARDEVREQLRLEAQEHLNHGNPQDLRHVDRAIATRAAVIALEHFPDLAIPLFRRALGKHSPCEAAAVLALIDQPWAHELLLEAQAGDSETSSGVASACRAALSQCHRALAIPAEEHPFDQGHLGLPPRSEMAESYVRVHMEQWHDRVMPLRGIVPPACPPEE